jgi:hypothetical protein
MGRVTAGAEVARGAASCGRIGFEPQTDNVAANIRAHDGGGLAFRDWVCTKNEARVTWDKY